MSALGTWSAPVTPMLGLKSIFPATDGLISIRPRRDRLLHPLVGIAPCCTWMPWHRSGGSGTETINLAAPKTPVPRAGPQRRRGLRDFVNGGEDGGWRRRVADYARCYETARWGYSSEEAWRLLHVSEEVLPAARRW